MAPMFVHRAMGMNSYLKNYRNLLLPHLVQIVSKTAGSARSTMSKVNLRGAIMCVTERKRELSL